MPRKKVKKIRKTVKFKTITIKVSARQKKSLINYCRSRHTTVNKAIKKSIHPLLENYGGLETVYIPQVRVNQLELF